jgi:CHASE2 domain/CHAT domain
MTHPSATHPSVYRLSVQRVDRTCLFELAWGQAQRLSAQVNYPESLRALYQEWQRIYLSFYHHDLLGQAEVSGTFTLPTIDWHSALVKAEASLLYEFHQWLRSVQLYEIRAAIIQASKSPQDTNSIQLHLTCTPIELERLPWEAWEIGTDIGDPRPIRIVRTPANVRQESLPAKVRRPRILVIVGGDEQNDFASDLAVAIAKFRSIAQIEAVGWRLSSHEVSELKMQVQDAIVSPQGWDALLFFGHSNEATLTGGELAIAPNTWLTIQELTPLLLKAKEQGLQFALFNSCSGLNIAEALISLGLSQVAVMREPIHNTVAQIFLMHFLQGLAASQDVHEAMVSACRHLKVDKNLTYPSAYLIPSLFHHPNASLFRIKPWGWKQWIKQWTPNKQEILVVSALSLLSLLSPVQDTLLDLRTLTQAVYRDLWAEAKPVVDRKQNPRAIPPIVLIQIDRTSLNQANIKAPNPMDRRYLAKLIDRIAPFKPVVIGIDYLLDQPQPENDPILAKSVRKAIAEHQSWFVFAAIYDESRDLEIGVAPETGIAKATWSIQGASEHIPQYLELLPEQSDCFHTCPFSYLISEVYNLHYSLPKEKLLAPQLESTQNLRTQLFESIKRESLSHSSLSFLNTVRLSKIASFGQKLRQQWMVPLNDFSIPVNEAFETISASQVLEFAERRSSQSSKPLHSLSNLLQDRVVIIVPGGYANAGVRALGEDNSPVPLAIHYWRTKFNLTSALDNPDIFTGGEAHAYRTYQLLTQRLTTPIPDPWLIVVAAIFGKGFLQLLNKFSLKRHYGILTLASVGFYGAASLQTYISIGFLLPWVLPSGTFLYCVSLSLKSSSHEQAKRYAKWF